MGFTIIFLSVSSKYTAEKWAWLFGLHVHSEIVALFSIEENMITKYESNHLVEFEHRMKTSHKKTSEGVEFLQLFGCDFPVAKPQSVMRLKQLYIIIELQVVSIFIWLIEFFIYFFYNFVGDHN